MALPKHLCASITWSAAMLAAALPAAHAAATTLAVGATTALQDPKGLARSVPLTLTGGTNTITFSVGNEFDGSDTSTLGGTVSGFNALDIEVRPGAPTTQVIEAFVNETSGPPTRVSSEVISGLDSVSVDPVKGGVLASSKLGSFTLLAPVLANVTKGGSAAVSNLRFDLENKRIIADLDGLANGLAGAAPTSFTLRDVALFTIGAISGPTAFPVASLFSADRLGALEKAGYVVDSRTFVAREVVGYYADGGCPGPYPPVYACTNPNPPTPIYQESTGYFVTGETRLSGLALTKEAKGFLLGSLALQMNGQSALFNASSDFGTVTLKTSFTLGVPEPGTHALMGLGLLAMAWAVRRRGSRAA